MSPASLMTLGPCSTPLLFYPEDKKIIRVRDGGISLICPNGALLLPVLWKTELPAPPHFGLCFVGKCCGAWF